MQGHKMPDALAAPGVIMRLTLNLGEQECALQMEGFLDRDASQDEYDALARKMAITAEKERARRLLPGYRRQLENFEHLTNENKKKLAVVHAVLAEGKKQRMAKVGELTAERAKANSEAYEAHSASGRRAEMKPTPAVQRLDAKIRELAEGLTKDEAEAAAQVAILENEIKDGERHIFQAKALIEEYERLMRGEDIAEAG